MVAAFDGDSTGSVLRQTLETLRAQVGADPSLTDVKVTGLYSSLSDDEINSVMVSRHPVVIVTGSVVSDGQGIQLVWYRMYWNGNRPTTIMSISKFPNIDEFKDQFFSMLAPRPTVDPNDLKSKVVQFSDAAKLALVVTNAEALDNSFAPLHSPDVDATSVSDAPKQIGADVTVVENGTRVEILTALNEIFQRASMKPHALVYIYYSGHGVSGGPPVLVPSDFGTRGAIPISDIVALKAVAPNADTFLFLDTVLGSLASLSAPRLSVLAAGQPGQLVADSGPFTKELLKQLSELQGTDGYIYFDDLAQAVSRQVIVETQGENKPLALSFSSSIVAVAHLYKQKH